MSNASNNINVTVKVNEFVNIASTYIINTLSNSELSKFKMSQFLWGAPGLGKSDSIKSIAKIVSEETGKTVNITDVRLLLFNPVDLRGIPVADANKEFAIWLKPQIFNMDPSDDVVNILMLDELSAAPPSVQAAAYQITLDRKIGEHKLPDNCYVFGAGNRLQDKSVAYKMPKALANRLTHFEIQADLEDWKKWALSSGINEQIIGFLNFRPDMLMKFDSSSDDNAFCTPRSWEMASNYIKVFGGIENAQPCIIGCIGVGAAGEFKNYTQVYTKLPNVEDIFNGKDIEMPKEPSILYALSSAISCRVQHCNKTQVENVLKFTEKMPAEFAVLTVKDILLVPKMREKLLKVQQWIQWTKKYKDYIL